MNQQTQLVSIVFLFFLGLSACGKFIHSPYISKTENRNLNPKNVVEISNRATSFTNTYKVAVLSDTHDYYSDLKKQVDYINERKDEIAFVLHAGDATNLGMLVEWETYKSFIDDLEVPFVMVIGNHDMLTHGVSIYHQMFGDDLDFSFVFKQTKFIFINNNNWESNGDAPDMSFLENELVSSSETHKVIVAHVQPDDSHRYSEYEIDEMKNLVDTHNVKYFINGHNHNYGDGTFGTATRVTVGASVKGKLLIVDIADGGISHTFIDL